MKQILVSNWLFFLVAGLTMIPTSYAVAHQESFDKMGVVPPRNELPAPDFILKTLDDDILSLKDFKDKAILDSSSCNHFSLE